MWEWGSAVLSVCLEFWVFLLETLGCSCFVVVTPLVTRAREAQRKREKGVLVGSCVEKLVLEEGPRATCHLGVLRCRSGQISCWSHIQAAPKSLHQATTTLGLLILF